MDAPQARVFRDVRADAPSEVCGEKTLEAQIMDWADDMAYATNDADDWFRAGYMPLARLANDGTFRAEYVKDIVNKLMKGEAVEQHLLRERRQILHGLADRFFTQDEGPCSLFSAQHHSHRVYDPTSAEAGKAFKYLRGWVFDLFMSEVRIVERSDTSRDMPRRYRLALEKTDLARVYNEVLKGCCRSSSSTTIVWLRVNMANGGSSASCSRLTWAPYLKTTLHCSLAAIAAA